MRNRQIQTCDWCRESKRRCDKTKPTCSRCLRAGIVCSFSTSLNRNGVFNSNSSSPNPLTAEDWPYSQTSSLEPRVEGGSDEVGSVGKVVKRRVRTCLSCKRCHRLKVKCDKKLPCSRCCQSGNSMKCSYTYQKHTTNQPLCPADPFTSAGENLEAVITLWFWRRRGSSHFRALLSRIQSLAHFETPHFALAIQEHSENHRISDLVLPGNFPLGSPQAAKYSSIETVLALIQNSHSRCQSYIEHYLNLYQPIHPIVDVEVFQGEVAEFWNNPHEMNLGWLAQFLMVLGLGAFGASREPEPAEDFFFASEACLAKTPFLFRPSLSNLRTLCLTIVAKQVANATCWALDSCWSMIGLIVRLAMMLGLDQNRPPPSVDAADLHNEMANRCRLWTIIIYFDIQMSIISGMSSVLPQDAIAAYQVPHLSNPGGTAIYSWESILLESFPLIFHVLARANSSTHEIDYEEVLQYDMEIRRMMRRVVPVEGNGLLRLSLDVFFRRVLMVLHRCHSLHPNAPNAHPVSYWSSLECSLALLVHHRELCDDPCLPPNTSLVSRFFMMDFFAAALTICIHLLWKDAPLAATMTRECLIPPRQTILDTIKSCQGIWLREENKSACFRTGCRLLETSLDKIEETTTQTTT
ncbi:uncharacterized protein BDR25DRAFT_291173 [Lindgomyces ingoldianus]|uniref:Uncharacterized protein n=1 Tax=Lindgomyces ingoldianus TaxID=673940 RepID=A0ACB6QLK7_9PLEO|nr:uncharacterized protein BDR25DRAFT_291173 [Lindgomyces ingoldianus]KAF2467806.1 hypothetical protein BDR25DRAFT_291173 [Lindgomyces ingoldianus]